MIIAIKELLVSKDREYKPDDLLELGLEPWETSNPLELERLWKSKDWYYLFVRSATGLLYVERVRRSV
jgi:hypothetical protein